MPLKYVCPVCGYNQMARPPQNGSLCECCCTEFGVSDVGRTHDQLRDIWIKHGTTWRGEAVPPPDWSACQQLRNIGYKLSEKQKKFLARWNVTD